MTEKTEDLRDIFVEVTDEQTVTERQQEAASKDPVDAEAAAATHAVRSVREDGLEDAVAGAEAEVDGASA